MNLGEWKQLENHLYNIKCFLTNKEPSKEICSDNNEEQNNSYGYNDMNLLRFSKGDVENAFSINPASSLEQNMSDLDEDYIHFNEYIESYNLKKMKNI